MAMLIKHKVNQEQEKILSILNQLQDPITLDSVCQQEIHFELEHKPTLYTRRLIVFDFLCRQLQPNAPLLNWALCFIGQHYCLTQTLFVDLFDSRRQHLFHQCFKLLDEAYRDLQTHRLLYDLLNDLRMPSCAWLTEIEASLHMQYQHRLQQCEQILENQVIRPSLCAVYSQQFIENIPSTQVAKSVSIQIRLALYHELQPVETAPLFKHLIQAKTYQPRECFQFSEPWIQLIQNKTPLISLFNNEIDSMTEQFFADQKDELSLLLLDEPFINELQEQQNKSNDIPNVSALLNECFQILGCVPSRFMAQITLLNISLMQTFLQFHHNQDITWDECCRLCDAAWGHALASLLDRAMFEKCPASESKVVRSLAKLCSCAILLYQVLGIQYAKENRMQLWKRYSQHRTLFIESFSRSCHHEHVHDKKTLHPLARDLTIVQRLLFT